VVVGSGHQQDGTEVTAPTAASPPRPVSGERAQTVKREEPGKPVPARGPFRIHRVFSGGRGSTSGRERCRKNQAPRPLPPINDRWAASGTSREQATGQVDGKKATGIPVHGDLRPAV